MEGTVKELLGRWRLSGIQLEGAESGSRGFIRHIRRPAASTISSAVVILASLGFGLYWIRKDHSTPSWDQANYLTLVQGYVDALHHRGIAGLPSQIFAQHARGPLLQLLVTPLFLAFGPSVDSALALHLLLLPVLLISVHFIARTLFGRGWIPPFATLFTAGTPLLLGLMHEVLVEFLLTTLTALAVLLILRSRQFSRRQEVVLFGIVFGLGLLTKFTFPQFIAGPLITALFLKVPDRSGSVRAGRDTPVPLRQRTITLAAGLFIGAALCSPWYLLPGKLPGVLHKMTGQFGGGGQFNLALTLRRVPSYALGLANDHLSWPLALATLIGSLRILVLLRKKNGAFKKKSLAFDEGLFADPAPWIFLLSWFAIPTVLMGLGINQDIRLIAPAFPAAAIFSAATLCSLRREVVRRVSLLVCTLLILAQVVSNSSTFPPRIPIPQFGAGSPTGATLLGSGPQHGYLRPPAPRDEAAPVAGFLAHRTKDVNHPVLIAVLRQDRDINPNSLDFLARLDKAHLVFDPALLREPYENLVAERLRKYEYVVHLCSAPVTSPKRLGNRSGKESACLAVVEKMSSYGRPVAEFHLSSGRRVFVIERGA